MGNVKQKIQESEYIFPYHYIPQFEPYFTQTISWTWGLYYISTLDFIINKLKKIQFYSLCDIGCGDGRLLSELNNTFPGKKLTGIDNSKRAIGLAKLLNPEINYINCDILKHSHTYKYDVITLIEVFEHIPLNYTEKFVKAISCLLIKKGLLLLTVPHKNKPLQIKHYQHFDLDTLKKYFSCHFEFIEVVYFERKKGNSLLLKFLIKLLNNKYFIITNKGFNSYVYQKYKQIGFVCNEKVCGRMFALLRKK